MAMETDGVVRRSSEGRERERESRDGERFSRHVGLLMSCDIASGL